MCLPGVSFVSLDMPAHPSHIRPIRLIRPIPLKLLIPSSLLFAPRHTPASVMPVFLRPDPPIKVFSHNNAKKYGYPDWETLRRITIFLQYCMPPLRYSIFSTQA